MKRNGNLFAVAVLLLLVSGTFASCCSENDGDYAYESGYFEYGDSSNGLGGSSGSSNTKAGIVTAGEWNDLAHWDFWSQLMLGQEYADKSGYWEIFTNHRVPVEVTDGRGTPVAGLAVKLLRNDATLWETVTDNRGQAELWYSPWQKSDKADASSLTVSIEGQVMQQQPVVCTWDSLSQPSVNRYVVDSPSAVVKLQADIAFVVDATGSMTDEIDFLKSDLLDIVGKASALRPEQTLRTATLFYRDEDDAYVTRYSDFTADATKTAAFVRQQGADGGGDYPEAVHTALEHTLKDLSWSHTARTRLAFLILDAPAHHQSDVIHSLQQSLTECARQGIRIIPVAASGVNKETEFMLRFFATITGGTYVFLTNDSGVGLDHIKATVGDYEVEKLNELIIRLISLYTA